MRRRWPWQSTRATGGTPRPSMRSMPRSRFASPDRAAASRCSSPTDSTTRAGLPATMSSRRCSSPTRSSTALAPTSSGRRFRVDCRGDGRRGAGRLVHATTRELFVRTAAGRCRLATCSPTTPQGMPRPRVAQSIELRSAGASGQVRARRGYLVPGPGHRIAARRGQWRAAVLGGRVPALQSDALPPGQSTPRGSGGPPFPAAIRRPAPVASRWFSVHVLGRGRRDDGPVCLRAQCRPVADGRGVVQPTGRPARSRAISAGTRPGDRVHPVVVEALATGHRFERDAAAPPHARPGRRLLAVRHDGLRRAMPGRRARTGKTGRSTIRRTGPSKRSASSLRRSSGASPHSWRATDGAADRRAAELVISIEETADA